MQLASVIVQLSLCFCEGSFVFVWKTADIVYRCCISISITLSAHGAMASYAMCPEHMHYRLLPNV